MEQWAAYEHLNNLDVWRRMATTTLDQMRRVKLMNRIDTKYVLSEDALPCLLDEAAAAGYRVQLIDGVRACRYDTLYYDTAPRDMYLAHHNRILTRQKIRTRCYVESGVTFLEIKNKSNRGRTRKKRIEIAPECFDNISHAEGVGPFFAEHAHYACEVLSPALSTRFVRITLVNDDLTERLTIDLDLHYRDMRSGCESTIERMAIVELKQDGRRASAIKDILRRMRIMPLKVSKYCLGTTLTVADIRRNRFKEKLREIEKQLNR